MKKTKELDELKELARLATCEALKGYVAVPDEWEKNLTLGTFFDNEHRIFELYVASEEPEGAIVISSARVNRLTKSVHVTVSNLAKKIPPPEII